MWADRVLVFLLFCCVDGKYELQESKPAASPGPASVNPLQDEPQAFPGEERANLPVFTMDYSRIQVPFEFTLWILLASFAKIGMFGCSSFSVIRVTDSFSVQVSTFTTRSPSGSQSPASLLVSASSLAPSCTR